METARSFGDMMLIQCYSHENPMGRRFATVESIVVLWEGDIGEFVVGDPAIFTRR